MSINDWLMIFAVIIAPISAVQVQKIIENYREARGRKIYIFKTLMATRASTLSFDHVHALNMIDLEFYDKKYSKVKSSWRLYLDHLGSFPVNGNEQIVAVWSDRRSDLFASLLVDMGQSIGFDFDSVHIKKSIYYPEAHGRIEDQNSLIRDGMIKLLYGENSLKMEITDFPSDENLVNGQQKIQKGLLDVLSGTTALKMKIEQDS